MRVRVVAVLLRTCRSLTSVIDLAHRTGSCYVVVDGCLILQQPSFWSVSQAFGEDDEFWSAVSSDLFMLICFLRSPPLHSRSLAPDWGSHFLDGWSM